MKFWEKLFICMMIIFQIFFVSSSVYLIKKSFTLNLSQEINSGISEESRLRSMLRINVQIVKTQKAIDISGIGFNKSDADDAIKTTLNDMNKNIVFVDVTDFSKAKIYNNFVKDIPVTGGDLEKPLNTADYVIKDIDNKTYLFVNENVAIGVYN